MSPPYGGRDPSPAEGLLVSPIVSPELLQHATRYHELFGDLVAIASTRPLRVWQIVGDADRWPDADIAKLLTAGIVASLSQVWMPTVVRGLLGSLEDEDVRFEVASHRGATADLDTRRLLWALACTQANRDEFEACE